MRAILIFVFVVCLNSCQIKIDNPNILVIYVDGLGYCDSGLYGCTKIPTPNIKRLGEEGVLFTQGYVSSPVCSPSRAGLLTGRYQQRFGHEFLPSSTPDSQAGMPLTETTLADALKNAGYVTGMVGKWHLGVQERFHPNNRGFETFYGILTATTDYIDPTREDAKYWVPVYEGYQIPDPYKDSPWQGRGDRPVMRGKVAVEENDYLTEAFSREAVNFINKNSSRPFFLYLPYLAPHGPLQVTEKYYDRFPHIKDEASRIQAAMVSALDDGIGQVIDALERNDVEENTLIFFVSDNGGGVAHYTSNDPLRLGKQTMFEGGIRVPFVMKWPRKIPRGVVFEPPVSALDIFPTAYVAAGGVPRENMQLDGVDLLPYLEGSKKLPPHENLFWRAGSIWAVREDTWKLIYAADRYWLFDLKADVVEQNNMADLRPDVVKRLQESYDEWNRGNIAPLWPPFGAKSNPMFFVGDIEVIWTF